MIVPVNIQGCCFKDIFDYECANSRIKFRKPRSSLLEILREVLSFAFSRGVRSRTIR